MERVRFAPSPTGPLHIGGVRTALFNYLYAKKNGGVFVVRIEDTDQNRYMDGAEPYIFESLDWLGIAVDESPVHEGKYGPYRQSERKDIYQHYIKTLIASGGAYYAFDSKEQLDALRKAAENEGKTFFYGKHNRDKLFNSLTVDTLELNHLLKNTPYVIRLKNDEEAPIETHDLLRGSGAVHPDDIDDKILIKADGMPTYHFANVVDDHLMKITTVIRGEEWLPSLALHQLIYKYFSWEPPKFIHLPLILKPAGKGKLSKRDGDVGGFPVFPLQWNNTEGFKEKGFVREGLINYLSLLGWNSGTNEELFTLDAIVKKFSVEGLQKGGARFDIKKAEWVNGQHLQKLATSDIIERSGVYYSEINRRRIELVLERANTLQDIHKMLEWFETNPMAYDEKVLGKIGVEKSKAILTACINILVTETLTKAVYIQILQGLDIKMGQGMQCLRLALFGQLVGPDLFEFMEMLEKDVVLKRLSNFINFLK